MGNMVINRKYVEAQVLLLTGQGIKAIIISIGLQISNLWNWVEPFFFGRDFVITLTILLMADMLIGIKKHLNEKTFSIKAMYHKFVFKPLTAAPIPNDIEMDSLRQRIYRLPFYEGLIFNSKNEASLMAITFDNQILNSPGRIPIINIILEKSRAFTDKLAARCKAAEVVDTGDDDGYLRFASMYIVRPIAYLFSFDSINNKNIDLDDPPHSGFGQRALTWWSNYMIYENGPYGNQARAFLVIRSEHYET
jgi:hypothetical protein